MEEPFKNSCLHSSPEMSREEEEGLVASLGAVRKKGEVDENLIKLVCGATTNSNGRHTTSLPDHK